MSVLVTSKRPHADIDAGDEVESPEVKVVKPNSEHPSHPYYILEHIVRNVLPEKCCHEKVKAFYKTELDKPQETIDTCRSKLAGWVLELWEKGTLYKYHS